jgi:large subunit ribosomal protein L25
LRVDGKIPCVLYNGSDNVHFTVTISDVRPLIFTPNVYIVELNIDGKKVQAIKKDIQYHPVTDEILHIDFLPVVADKPVVMGIPVKLFGLAEGVKEGGKLIQELRYLKVRAMYTQFPDTLDVDVTALVLGKTIQVKDLAYEGLEILNSLGAVVASVKLTRAARAAAGDATEGAAV